MSVSNYDFYAGSGLTLLVVELHMMRQPRYRFTQEYVNQYKQVFPPSEPIEDFDDRNALYAM
jgi:protein-ribulosamine 3-kinase